MQSAVKLFTAESELRIDGIAGWGTKLLPSRVFQENESYQRVMKQIINSDSSMISPYWWVAGSTFKGRFDNLMAEWSHYFADTISPVKTGQLQYSLKKNETEYRLEVLELRTSGTEANNYFYELAGYAFQKRTEKLQSARNYYFLQIRKQGFFLMAGLMGELLKCLFVMM